MAVASRNRLPFGYDEDFVDAVEDEIVCLICHLPFKKPVQTGCGHRFCEECLEEYFRRRVGEPLTCPADWQTLNREDIFPDKATERKVLSLNIRCPSDGCEWTGELRYKETHLASCPFRDVKWR
ncbi:TNF receptor-associated factor 6-B-like isoform X2 [Orbicella faveolata]|uniref:TNF receptor-associated factor 6-B-like isoform X2 n=1 Tax=Orbicella faveolata TaxID=48498 RepID=UPI0009E593C4|nr:TNF receptor-associated factor 6-B-like isoform X2 [Orbicella faveolata]